MKPIHLLILALIVPALAQATDPTIQLKVAFKATTYSASGGKIVKNLILNSTLVSECTAVAGAQLVAVFDTVTKNIVELDVVNPCGSNLCQVATFITTDGTCADTGIVNGKEELVCPPYFTANSGKFGGYLITDTKLTLDAQNQPTGGSVKMVGVIEDANGNYGVVAMTVSSVFKPASGCP